MGTVLLSAADGQDNRPLAFDGSLFDILPSQVLQPNVFFQCQSPCKKFRIDGRLIFKGFESIVKIDAVSANRQMTSDRLENTADLQIG